ncbi:MAG: hypothetical protein RLY86_2721 [Pseudomonadota bacterium]|jgi:hypothetical protein
MDKYTKSTTLDELEPLADLEAADDIFESMVRGGDPLKFIVLTKGGYPHQVDLSRYRDGDTELGLIGFPGIIGDLLPLIKTELGRKQRSRKAISTWLDSRLPKLFKWMTSLSVAAGPDAVPKGVVDFTAGDGALFKRFILGMGGNLNERKKQFGYVLGLISAARELAAKKRGEEKAEPLLWPTIEIEEGRYIHADVEVEAVKALYHTCKRTFEAGVRAWELGQHWLATGVDPRHDSNAWGNLRERGTRGSVKNPVWHDPANLCVLARAWMEDHIVGTSTLDTKAKKKLNNHTTKSAETFAGVTLRELYAALAPTPLEVAAGALIVSMETGWIDPVDAIDLNGQWYIFRRGVDPENANKLDSVVLQTIRPKTGRKVMAIGQAGPRFRSFQIIRAMERRTTFLREMLRRRRVVLEAQPDSLERRQEMAEIERQLRRPWLYYNMSGVGAAACGAPLMSAIVNQLPTLKRIAIEALPQNFPGREKRAAAIDALTWSDIRDAFATFIFDNSGQNPFILQRALSHGDPRSQRAYLRQKRQLRDRFDRFRTLMESALREVQDGRSVDPTVLYLSNNYLDFSDADRDKLKHYRTRMGMGCAAPMEPEDFLAPRHPTGAICAVQRCILCRHGIVFAGAFEGLADRYADLLWLREGTPPQRWLTSTFWWELEAIIMTRDKVFRDKQAAFMARSEDRLAGLRTGALFVFDDPDVAGGLV